MTDVLYTKLMARGYFKTIHMVLKYKLTEAEEQCIHSHLIYTEETASYNIGAQCDQLKINTETKKP